MFVKKGTKVCVRPKKTPKGKGLSYGKFCGVLLDDATIGMYGGWDVYDIKTASGRVKSAYGFSIDRKSKK